MKRFQRKKKGEIYILNINHTQKNHDKIVFKSLETTPNNYN